MPGLIIYTKIAQNKSRLTGYRSYGNWQGINVTYGVHYIMIIIIIMLRAFPVNSLNFCTVQRMNNDFYLLVIYFFKYTFQQIFYLFSISFKYYFFILFLFFLYSFLIAIFFKFPILIFLKFHNIFKFCSKKRTRGDNFFFLSIV